MNCNHTDKSSAPLTRIVMITWWTHGTMDPALANSDNP